MITPEFKADFKMNRFNSGETHRAGDKLKQVKWTVNYHIPTYVYSLLNQIHWNADILENHWPLKTLSQICRISCMLDASTMIGLPLSILVRENHFAICLLLNTFTAEVDESKSRPVGWYLELSCATLV